jgi:hypothetical protein
LPTCLRIVEVVPGVSEGAALHSGQNVQEDALEEAYGERMGQESLQVALFQAGRHGLE